MNGKRVVVHPSFRPSLHVHWQPTGTPWHRVLSVDLVSISRKAPRPIRV